MLLQIHGGGWVIGEKEQQGVPLMMHMAARGWMCAAINYPLSPQGALARAPRRASSGRSRGCASTSHEYGGDPSFVAVTGGSAGGHLAAMLALTGERPQSLQPGFEDVDTTVQACVPHYGVYDFTDESGTRASKVRLRSPAAAVRDGRGRASTPTTTARRRRCSGCTRTRRRSSCCTARTTRWCPWPTRARSSTALREVVEEPGCLRRDCAARSTPSTSSRRSAARTSCAASSASSSGRYAVAPLDASDRSQRAADRGSARRQR